MHTHAGTQKEICAKIYKYLCNFHNNAVARGQSGYSLSAVQNAMFVQLCFKHAHVWACACAAVCKYSLSYGITCRQAKSISTQFNLFNHWQIERLNSVVSISETPS